MKEIVCGDGDLKIYKINARYWVRYDAGAHQVEMREDEISKDEVDKIMNSESGASEVLFALQKKLIASGVNPYKTNLPK